MSTLQGSGRHLRATMSQRERFLAACNREPVDCTPVWFMRQAGRYLPQYREIRKNFSVIDVCKTPSLCEKVTLLPVRELGVDAAVMFADIMLPLEGMGISFRIEENLGPVIADPVRNLEAIDALHEFQPEQHVPYLVEAIGRVSAKLAETRTALIGFSGAPFTIASYVIEGRPSRDFSETKRMMYDKGNGWHLLMSKLSQTIVDYLITQIQAGCDALQLFDSWVGALSVSDYLAYVAPHTRAIFHQLKKEHPNVPLIHFSTASSHLLGEMGKRVGGDVYSVDWRIPLSQAAEALGNRAAMQGNLDPAVLLSIDSECFIAQRVQEVLDEGKKCSGHIFSLGHGVLRGTPVENAKFVVRYVHENT